MLSERFLQSNEMAGREGEEEKRKRVAVVVGGSIGGLCCAHSLLQSSQWLEVVVFERARSSVTAATGAGLCLDPHACSALRSWGLGDALEANTLPLTIEENRAVDGNGHDPVVVRDESFNHRAAHWSDLHRLIHDALPPGVVRYDHEVVSFDQHHDANGQPRVRVRVAKGGGAAEEVEADFMVACDGSMSDTRAKFVPNEPRRYAGYCAWRGVLEQSNKSAKEVTEAIEKAYPDIGNCLYFDIAHGTHAVLYKLVHGRLNWLWYVNQPEPELKGKSVTVQATEESIRDLQRRARETWPAPLAALVRATTNPFINAIFDREPLARLVHGRVVLAGEAAHPTTPHGLRSTNMAVADALVLGDAVRAHGAGRVADALDAYQRERVPAVAREVHFSRRLGRLKQGQAGRGVPEDWNEGLLQKNVHCFQYNGEDEN